MMNQFDGDVMSELTEALKEYRKILDALQSENKRYYTALLQASMYLQNNAIADAQRTLEKVLGTENV